MAGAGDGDPYAGRKVQRRFWVMGSSSKSVERLAGVPTVIRKTYNPNKEIHMERYEREVALLTRVLGCPFVPQLLHVNRARSCLYMSDCGTSLDNVTIYRRRK